MHGCAHITNQLLVSVCINRLSTLRNFCVFCDGVHNVTRWAFHMFHQSMGTGKGDTPAALQAAASAILLVPKGSAPITCISKDSM